jgi:hypothetical protein
MALLENQTAELKCDVDERKGAQSLLSAEKKTLERIAGGASRTDTDRT